MRVLVTGAAGYIGSVVVTHLLAAGIEVVAFDKLVYGGESLLAFRSHPYFRFRWGDVRDRARLREAMAGVSAVIHLAAVVGEPACSLDPEESWSINYAGTEAVLQTAAECSIERVLFASTCSNYGVSDPETLADESVPLNPLSKYAESKTEAERLVLANASGPCSLVLRLGTICGLSPRMRFDLLVSDMARACALGEPIRVFAPDAWRPFLHVNDAGRAFLHCVLEPAESLRGKVFNVVGENCQKKHLVGLVLLHYPNTTVEITDREPDLRDYRVDGSRITREIGFKTIWSVEDAFLETAEAVASGVFRDPMWRGYSATPLEC